MVHPFKTLTRCIFYYDVRCQFFKCILPSEKLKQGYELSNYILKVFPNNPFEVFYWAFISAEVEFAAQATRPRQAEGGQEEDNELDEQLHSNQLPDVRHRQNLRKYVTG